MVIQEPLSEDASESRERISIFRLMGEPSEETLPGVTTFFPFIYCYEESEPKDLAILLPDLEPAGVDLLQKMLRVNPKERITVNDALNHHYFRDVENYRTKLIVSTESKELLTEIVNKELAHLKGLRNKLKSLFN
ncbi:cell division control protein 2 homolog A [Citrus clementina]|uniref:cell division control protein 2 homolog A n=1 Tax=Citrus clementina TaxID=85681 RepID=UPI000CED737D|nr:cell division control protein 2 homolog A [Citrus x clementina]